jgi:hypothetical protein
LVSGTQLNSKSVTVFWSTDFWVNKSLSMM